MASFTDVIVAVAGGGGGGTGNPPSLAYFSGVNVVSGAANTALTAAGALTVASLAIGATGSGFTTGGALTATSGTFSLPSAVNSTLVMGAVAFGNLLAGIAFVQNTTSGTAAGSALYFGNDTGASGVGYVAGYSSAHSTKPSYLEIMNTQNAPVTLGTNGVVRMTIAAAGGITIPLTLGVTGVITATGGVVGNVTGNVSGTAGSTTLVTAGGTVTTGALTATAGNFSLNMGIGIAANPSVGLYMAYSGQNAATSYGGLFLSLFPSAVTANGNALDVQFGSAVASFTMATGRGILIEAPTVGAGSTVTTIVGLEILNQSGGGTNYAIRTGTGLVSLGGAVSLSSTLGVTGATQLGDPAAAALTTIGGTGYGAGVASVRFNGLTTAATNNLVGTLSNAPVTGNPTFWMPVSIAGVIKYVPCF